MPTRPSDQRRVQESRIRRQILIQAMGGRCEDCGDTEDLEFHHTEHREWIAAELSRWERQKRYESEWADGVLMLLCSTCNKVHGRPVTESAEVAF